MIYEKDQIKRLIEYKDKVIDNQIKNDLEWIVEAYNMYFINSKEYDKQGKAYKTILNKYYNVEDEKANLKEQIMLLKQKYRILKETYNTCCKNFKNMI